MNKINDPPPRIDSVLSIPDYRTPGAAQLPHLTASQWNTLASWLFQHKKHLRKRTVVFAIRIAQASRDDFPKPCRINCGHCDPCYGRTSHGFTYCPLSAKWICRETLLEAANLVGVRFSDYPVLEKDSNQ